jgi:hypothetical protein
VCLALIAVSVLTPFPTVQPTGSIEEKLLKIQESKKAIASAFTDGEAGLRLDELMAMLD